jgi:hypothetical protein
MRVPPVVRPLQPRHGGRGRRRWRRAPVVEPDRLALGGDVEPSGRPVLAVHVDEVPQAPGDRRERLGIRAGEGPVDHPGAVVALADRPAPRRRLPEVLLVVQALDPGPRPPPHLVGQVDELTLHGDHAAQSTQGSPREGDATSPTVAHPAIGRPEVDDGTSVALRAGGRRRRVRAVGGGRGRGGAAGGGVRRRRRRRRGGGGSRRRRRGPRVGRGGGGVRGRGRARRGHRSVLRRRQRLHHRGRPLRRRARRHGADRRRREDRRRRSRRAPRGGGVERRVRRRGARPARGGGAGAGRGAGGARRGAVGDLGAGGLVHDDDHRADRAPPPRSTASSRPRTTSPPRPRASPTRHLSPRRAPGSTPPPSPSRWHGCACSPTPAA